MIIYPLQSFGLGDIIFCQKLVKDWILEGHSVVWGVEPQYVSIGKHFPNAKYVDKNTLSIDYNSKIAYKDGENLIVPLRWSVEHCNVPYKDCMKSKFMMFGKDWTKWKEFDMLRDYENEAKLFNLLGIEPGEKYNLINTFFTGENRESNIQVNGNVRNIMMNTLPGYTLLDWSKIIENANEIHTVGTSINYLIELLEPKCPIHLYVRKPIEKDFKNYDYILSEKLDYHFHL